MFLQPDERLGAPKFRAIVFGRCIDFPGAKLIVSRATRFVAIALLFEVINIIPGQIAEASNPDGSHLIQRAMDATASAGSFRVGGTISSGGSAIIFDVTMSQKAAIGTLSEGKRPLKVERVGDTIYASEESGSPYRWIVLPPSTSGYRDAVTFLTPSLFVKTVFRILGTYRFSDVHRSKLKGEVAMSVVGTHGSERDEFEIAATGRPYLLAIFRIGPSKEIGRMTFSDYNQTLNVLTPVGTHV